MQMNDMMITISMKTFEEMADRIEVLENNPSPEAIVKAALERAREMTALMPMQIPANPRLSYHAALEAVDQHIEALACDPAEVAAIIKKAGEDRG
jgi:predicted short-subunit dehydrogenase-like oxidoreductase (DUF2520 family)